MAHWLAMRIYNLPINANQVSILAMIMAFIGTYFYIYEEYIYNLFGVFFF